MTTTTKPKRWLRLTLTLAVVAGVFTFVVLPSIPALRKRHEILSALRSAVAIRLEEFLPGHGEPDTILTTRALTAAEHHHVSAAIPITFPAGIPGLFKPCWEPHHRVVITAPDHHEITLAVCFTCSEVSYPDAPTNHPIIRMPSAWREPLQQLFLRRGVPIRDNYDPYFILHAQSQ